MPTKIKIEMEFEEPPSYQQVQEILRTVIDSIPISTDSTGSAKILKWHSADIRNERGEHLGEWSIDSNRQFDIE